MKKYVINPVRLNEQETYWQLYETASEAIVATFPSKEDAVAASNWMSNGGAFDGFTPNFILINTRTLDEKFEKAFQ